MNSDQPKVADERPDRAGHPLTRSPITVETALWVFVGILALVLRLAHLGAAPLSADEAREAMLAWRAVTGQGMPEAGYSPLLLTLNTVLFILFGASDALARLGPALLGCLLALTPWLFRRRIGRVGTLVAGSYLAISPTALAASRRVDGAAVAALGGMAFLGGLARFLDSDRRSWLTLSAGGLALAVTSSPSAYGLFLTMGLSWLLLASVWPNGGVGRLWERARPHLGHVLLVAGLAGLALSTGLGWNLPGLGVAGSLLPGWIAGFGRSTGSAASPLTVLTIYEPLGLLFGLIGLVQALQRGDRPGLLLGLWVGLGALLATLMPGRTVLDAVWALLPLAMLTGNAIDSLVRGLREHGAWLSEGLYAPVVVLLWIHLVLMLGRYAVSGNAADLALVLLTAALQVLLAMIFALAMSVDGALRALGVGTGIALLAVTLSAGWGASYVRPSDPRELLSGNPTDPGVRDLVRTLRERSWRETGIPQALPFTYEASADSLLAWYLRDFSAAQRADRLDLVKEEDTLVTTRRDLSGLSASAEETQGMGAAFVGQDFVLRRRWSPIEVGCAWEWPPQCGATVQWLLFRDTPSVPEVDQWAVLWLHQESAEAVSE
jgi:uncharacterized protein (TIGR03663 family)